VQPSPAGAAALHGLGLSVASYAGLALAASLLSTLVYFAVAGVIVWRKSDDWMALLVALAEVALGTVLVSGALLSGNSTWQFPILDVSVFAYQRTRLSAPLAMGVQAGWPKRTTTGPLGAGFSPVRQTR